MFGLRVAQYQRPLRRTVCKKISSRGSTSWKLLVLILLCFPTLVAAADQVSSSGGGGSSLSKAAAASLLAGMSGCAHRTRNWTRDERRLEGRCRKFGVEYTSPHTDENEHEQSERRTRLKEECNIKQKERRRSKVAKNVTKKRRIESATEKAVRLAQDAQRKRHRRAEESPEEAADRLAQDAQRKRHRRAAETPEEAADRRQQGRDRYQDIRAGEEEAFDVDDIFLNGKIPFIDVSLEGVTKARTLLTRTKIVDDDDKQQRHRAIGCVVCDGTMQYHQGSIASAPREARCRELRGISWGY